MSDCSYLIVGGGLAGQRAAQGIRKVDTQGTVALVTAEPHVPYERPPLSKGYLIGKEGLDAAYLQDDAWYEENGIVLMKSRTATGVDAAAHSVVLDDGQELEYGKLLLATGGRARRLPIPGADLPNIFTLRTIEDSDGIRAAAEAAGRALVLGGSFIGSEVAASLTQLGLDVTMVFPESRLLERVVPQAFSDMLQSGFRDEGVSILDGVTPERFEGDTVVKRALLSDGRALDVGLVVMGVGIRLNTALAQSAGLELTERDEVVVDQYLGTSDPDIYAAGDIAAWPDPTFERRLRVEHWDVARRQGLRAGRNMAGEQKPYTALPYFFSDMFDTSFEVWGNLMSWDQTVLRGELGVGSYQLFYFDLGTLVAVLTVGRLGDDRKTIPQLVKARPTYEDVADLLPDPAVELSSLLD